MKREKSEGGEPVKREKESILTFHIFHYGCRNDHHFV